MQLKFQEVSDTSALSLLRWTAFFQNAGFILPVIVLLYMSKGLTVGDFFLIQGLFSLASFLFEIPSGYISDVFSRKKVLSMAFFLWFLGYAILFFAEGFAMILLVESIWGISHALFSGTREAYSYDLLKRLKMEKKFLKEQGAIQTYAQVSMAISTFIGGALYAIMADNLILLCAAFTFFSFFFSLYLPELPESRRKVVPEKSPLQDIMGIVKFSIKHPEIKWFMVFPAMIASFTLVIMWTLQPTMESVGVPVALFGLFVGINQSSRVLFSHQAHRLFDILGLRKCSISFILLIIIGIFAVLGAIYTANTPYIYLFCALIAIIPATQVMLSLVFTSLIHHRIESHERGTVLSVYAMTKSLFSCFTMILMKPMLDGFGIQTTMFLILFLVLFTIYPLKRILSIKIV